MHHTLFAAVAIMAMAGPAIGQVLYTNGTIITNPGAGAAGFDVSQASADFDTLGFSVLSPARLADDFSVPQPGWRVNRVAVNGYVTGSYPVPPTASPLTGLTLSLWRGAPEAGGSQLIATSTSIVSNAFSGIYRVSNGPGNFGVTDRPVFELAASFPDTELSPGTYWIDYSISAGANVFSPMVMSGTPAIPTTFAGNAQRKLSAGGIWVTLFGGLSQQGLDFPFTVGGSVIPEPAGAAALGGLALLRRRR